MQHLRFNRRVALLLALCLNSIHLESSAETIQCPAVKDNSIVMVDGEWSDNAGQNGRIRIKGNQHIVAMAFDLSSIAGKQVKKATLICARGDADISGVTISTIATPWDENRSNGLTAGTEGVEEWGYKGARFPAVSGGNGFTIVHQAESNLHDGRYHWDVAPDIVHAMSIGVAHGIAIHEHDSDYSRNPTIFSRGQTANRPYLLVELDDRKDSPPLAATNLRIVNRESDSARLVLSPPTSGFAYDITIDGVPLGRHNVPLIGQVKDQVVFLRDLPDSIRKNETNDIKVVTLNRLGQSSEPASIQAGIFYSASIEKPEIPAVVGKRPIADVGIIPVTDKYDQEGKPVGKLPGDYRVRNRIYDGQAIRLRAAAGEVVGFQLLVKGRSAVSIDCRLEETKAAIELWQAVYVPANGRMIPDPLLPIPKSIELNLKTDQVIVADVYIPFDENPGIKKGGVLISDGRTIPLEIEVLPWALPKKATFFCEMNGYGLPDHVDEYYALQRIAYDHRVHANILHYSHNTAAPGSRKSSLDMRLRSGRRMDNKRYDNIEPGAKSAFWDDFAEAFGPYLNGSLFADGHRGPIPAPGFYLTFHESWPLNCRAYFNGNLDAYAAFSDQPLYSQTYVNILKDFRERAAKEGWTQTGFQVYLNNKGSLGEKTKAPWILDEPTSYWDYRALRYFGELTDQARDSSDRVKIDYRIDISRPEYCRGQLERPGDLWVVSSSAFRDYRRLVADRMELEQLKAWIYGTSNHVHESNRSIQAWALDSWQGGATGILPWQTVDKTGNALKEADQLGLFIFDKDSNGKTAIRHSLRLKAFREAQQLIEHLNLLQARRGWSQDQLRRFVNQYVDLRGEVSKTNDEDAGTPAYERSSPEAIEGLRWAIMQL